MNLHYLVLNRAVRAFTSNALKSIMVIFLSMPMLWSCSEERFDETSTNNLNPVEKLSSNSVELNVIGVSASREQRGNEAENAIDNDPNSRWSGKGRAVDLDIDLGTSAPLIDYIKIAYYKGNRRTARFEAWTKADASGSWNKINSKTSSGSTTALETFDLKNTKAQFLRLKCQGTSSGDWNSITDIEVYGTPDSTTGGTDGGSTNGGDTSGGGTDGGTFNNPYDIPRFQDAIRKSKLQAPTSSTVATSSELQAGYSSSWFYVTDTDKIAFYQTGSSKRTELRFLNNWNVNNGNRSAHANLKFISQSGDTTTFLQIHDDANAGDGPNKPLLRMYRSKSRGSGNHLWAAIKTDSGGSATRHIDCGPAPSGYFDCDINLSNGNMVIKINGVTKVNRNVSFWNFPSYWKAGVYNQNSGGTRIHFNELTWN